MSVKERILTIRLIEKLQTRPELGKILGIAVKDAPPSCAEHKEK